MSDPLVQIGSDRLSAGVSSLGAEMQRLTASGRPLLWHGDPAFWSGRSPVLFPIVGRAPGDAIWVDGQEFPMAQHGFARRSSFDLTASGPDFCRHRLTDSDATRAAWPFRFALTVEHRIGGATLSVTATVDNRDDRPMPFGLGFHPAFLWPLPGAGGQSHSITLANGAEPEMARVRGGLLAPGRFASPFRDGALTLDPALFAEDAAIFPQGAGDALSYSAESGPRLTFRLRNLPNLALWSKPGAPFVCIEPWHGMAAAIGAGPELSARPFTVTLEPGGAAEFGFEVSVAE